MRRVVAVVGSAFVVFGFLGSLVWLSAEQPTSGWVGVPLMLLVPAGFVLLWEAQITWPRDGSPYPWQRRTAGLLVTLASVGVIVVVAGLLRATLPDGWVAHTLAQGAGACAGALIFQRLRERVSRRFDHDTSGPQQASP